MVTVTVSIDQSTTQKVGKRVNTNISTGEGDLFSILGDDERVSKGLIIQHSSELDDVQILIANILDGGNDHDFGRGHDLVGGSRERDLKTTGGANRRLRVSTNGRETKSKERQRAHGDAKECGGSCS